MHPVGKKAEASFESPFHTRAVTPRSTTDSHVRLPWHVNYDCVRDSAQSFFVVPPTLTPRRSFFFNLTATPSLVQGGDMSDKPFYIDQSLFKAECPPIRVVPCHENSLTISVMNQFMDSVDTGYVGVAPAYGANCKLVHIAFATKENVLLVSLSSKASRTKYKNRQQRSISGRELLIGRIFCDPDVWKCVFKMDKLAAALFLDLHSRVISGLDLLSVSSSASRHAIETFLTALGGETLLHKENVVELFEDHESAAALPKSLALQAWAAYRAGTDQSTYQRLKHVRDVTTLDRPTTHITFLAKTVRDASRLDALKPTRTRNDVSSEFSYKTGKLMVRSDRFKTRIRASSTQTIEIETVTDGRRSIIKGRAVQVEGRAATLQLHNPFQGKSVHSIVTVGKEGLTTAEGRREIIVLDAFRESNSLLSMPFVRLIWLSSEQPDWLTTPRAPRPKLPVNSQTERLNPSQQTAVQAIVSEAPSDRFVLVQGPPGTGKTSVIACATRCMIEARPRQHTIWLIAQSNVAVKNVAEKLAREEFWDFKLLVSRDFHFDWHEHLYEKIEKNVIRSDDFIDDVVSAERRLAGSRVILCTLSMMSHHRLPVFTRIAPIEVVIVDEASQIEIGDYIPMLHRYEQSIQKLVFIGDDKQLPPYGQDDLGDLRSIFEVPHLREHVIFLDTQYRMPVPLGDFISGHVYGGLLHTDHSITSQRCIRFVDCRRGVESRKGHSFVNIPEVEVVVALARQYASTKVSFRIITPYDAQRSAIERALKREGLPWEDKCFNVDAFQGNEDDHIIISLTRSEKIGFLKEIRRTNVMLTRCKRSMVICTSRAFLTGVASDSLVAILAEQLGPRAWIDSRSIQFK